MSERDSGADPIVRSINAATARVAAERGEQRDNQLLAVLERIEALLHRLVSASESGNQFRGGRDASHEGRSMKGLPEHEEHLGELTKVPEKPKPKDEGWRSVRPGIQENDKGQLRTNPDFLERRPK